MKKIFCLFVLLNLCLTGYAQSNSRITNYWDNLYYINPGAINSRSLVTISTVARKQWLGFPGSPRTGFLAATTYIDKMQTLFGAKLYSDKIGYTNVINASLSYAYSIILNERSKLSLGIAGSYQSLSYDREAINAEIPGDEAFFTSFMNTTNYNCDLGAQFTTRTLTLGLSTLNMFSMFYTENKLQYNTSFLYAKYRNMTRQPVNVGYGLSAIKTNSMYQMEANINTYIRYVKDPEFFQIGLFYRTRAEMGTILGVRLLPKLQMYYSYDFNVSGIRRSSSGTHELMLVFKIDSPAGCVTCDVD